jgi:hypothetical protein
MCWQIPSRPVPNELMGGRSGAVGAAVVGVGRVQSTLQAKGGLVGVVLVVIESLL